MEQGKKVEPIENTPPQVVKATTKLAAMTVTGFADTKITDKLTQEQKDFLFSTLIYLIFNAYLCAIVYVYLSAQPANNAFQDLMKKALKIK